MRNQPFGRAAKCLVSLRTHGPLGSPPFRVRCASGAPPAMAIPPSLASARQAPRNHPDPCQHLQSGLFSGMVAHLGQQTQEHVRISPGPAPSGGSEKPVDPSGATCLSYTAQFLPYASPTHKRHGFGRYQSPKGTALRLTS